MRFDMNQFNLSLLIVALLSLARTCSTLAAAEARPKVLIIRTDEHNFRTLGCYGSTHIRTPQVGKLPAEGLRFTHAYAPASTRTPSRYALLTEKGLGRMCVATLRETHLTL